MLTVTVSGLRCAVDEFANTCDMASLGKVCDVTVEVTVAADVVTMLPKECFELVTMIIVGLTAFLDNSRTDVIANVIPLYVTFSWLFSTLCTNILVTCRLFPFSVAISTKIEAQETPVMFMFETEMFNTLLTEDRTAFLKGVEW